MYAAAVAVVACVGALASAKGGPPVELFTVLGFGLVFIFAEAVPVTLTHVSYSVGFVVAICCVIAAGPAAAAAAAAFAAFDLDLRKRPDWLGRLFFNAGQFSVSTLALGMVYRSTGGPIGSLAAADFPEALIPITLGTAAFFITNTLLVSMMVRLVRRVPWREILYSDYRVTLMSYFSLAALGVLLAVLYLNISWAALPLIVTPLLGARHAFQTARRMQETFDSTLRGLIKALEAKDPYTGGHAERVSHISSLVARAYGFSESKVRRVRYAALMHDIGKTTIDTRVLQKPGKLTPEEYDHMKHHSARGAELVSEIDMLSDMVDGVRHHHERMDGRGYPDGLAGDNLSDVAKMIMVSDAFDSMTSTRSYRKAMPMEKAFAELRRCEGSQFAPEMIDALERAIARWGWAPTPEPFEGELTPRPVESPHAAHAGESPAVAHA